MNYSSVQMFRDDELLQCADVHSMARWQRGLAPKAVQGATLPLEGIHNIHSSNRLPLGMLSVGDCVPDDILQEHLQDTPGLLVDQTRNPLHSTPPCQSPNSRLGDSLDVVPQHLAMPLGSSLAQAFTSLSSTGHRYRTVDEVGIGIMIRYSVRCGVLRLSTFKASLKRME